MNPLGLFLETPGPLLTHLHTVYMAYSERLPTRVNPLAERTRFSQVPPDLLGGGGRGRGHAGSIAGHGAMYLDEAMAFYKALGGGKVVKKGLIALGSKAVRNNNKRSKEYLASIGGTSSVIAYP